jgi:hypothetical protein
MTNDKVRNVFESIIRNDPGLRAMFTVSTPDYRYFHHKGSKDQYFWTTEVVKHNGKKCFASGIYRYLKTKKQWKLTNETYHAKRKDAKARALKLWEDNKPDGK